MSNCHKDNEKQPGDEASKESQDAQSPNDQEGKEAGAHEEDGKHPERAGLKATMGFDAVVREERQKRKLTFGPNAQKVIKPSNILIDIYGVICSWEFAKTLKEYAKANLGDHVKENWNDKIIKAMVARLREQVPTDRMAGLPVPEIAPETAPESEQKETAAVSVVWQLEKRHSTTKDLISRVCADLWSKSYDSGRLKTHAYPDVEDAFHYWRFEEFIKIYSYASGPPEGQRQFLRASVLGDLNRFIANALNASGGYKQQADKFRSVASALREPNLKHLLYITDSPIKARSAIAAGLRALVVNRDNRSTGKFSPENMAGLTVVTTLADIEFVDDPNNAAPMNCC